jgi:uncharacterized protein (DUF433 family)
MATVVVPRIRLDEAGVAWIDGTTTKVIEVVLNKEWSRERAEELQPHMPHLTLAQIQAALAYYEGHKETLDVDIARRRLWVDEMSAQETEPLTRDELIARLRGKD